MGLWPAVAQGGRLQPCPGTAWVLEGAEKGCLPCCPRCARTLGLSSAHQSHRVLVTLEERPLCWAGGGRRAGKEDTVYGQHLPLWAQGDGCWGVAGAVMGRVASSAEPAELGLHGPCGPPLPGGGGAWPAGVSAAPGELRRARAG